MAELDESKGLSISLICHLVLNTAKSFLRYTSPLTALGLVMFLHGSPLARAEAAPSYLSPAALAATTNGRILIVACPGANRGRVPDLLASWKPLTDKYACSLSQLVLAWTAAQPGVTHVPAGGRNLQQVTDNARAGELPLESADLERIRRDVINLGEPAKA